MGRHRISNRVSLALRIDAGLLARVEAYAVSEGLDRTAALVALVGLGLGDAAPGSSGAATEAKPSSPPASSKPSASAVVRAAASAVAEIAPRARLRARKIVGFDPLSGDPIYGSA